MVSMLYVALKKWVEVKFTVIKLRDKFFSTLSAACYIESDCFNKTELCNVRFAVVSKLQYYSCNFAPLYYINIVWTLRRKTTTTTKIQLSNVFIATLYKLPTQILEKSPVATHKTLLYLVLRTHVYSTTLTVSSTASYKTTLTVCNITVQYGSRTIVLKWLFRYNVIPQFVFLVLYHSINVPQVVVAADSLSISHDSYIGLLKG